MTNKIKILFLMTFLISAIILLSACENIDDPKDSETIEIPDGIDVDLIQKVHDRFEEIFLAYNEKRYEDYLTYYKIDDEQKNMMLESFQSNSMFFDSKYEIKNVYASQSDDGISATIIYYSISTNSNGDSSIIEETMYYKLMEENGGYYISSYESGPQTLIE